MRAIFVIAILLLLIGTMDARIPQKGDVVSIRTIDGYTHAGEIENITDQMICLKCVAVMTPTLNVDTYNPPLNSCVGFGTISSLIWRDNP